MKRYFITVLILLFALYNSFGADNTVKRSHKNYEIKGVKIGLNESRDLRIPPPEGFTDKSANLKGKANFIIRFNGFSNQSRAAFNYATAIWESIIDSPIDIKIDAYWTKLSGSTLAYCSSINYYLGYDGLMEPRTYFPVVLAEKMTRKNLNDSLSFDMEIAIDSDASWYYGTDGKTPSDKYDLVSVLLHEICHGLGFAESFYVQNNTGGWGLSSGFGLIYDKFVIDSKGNHLIDTLIYPVNSSELKDVLTSRVLYFDGPVLASEYGKKVSLYAPGTWESGSSISHLSNAYSTGDNSLMTATSYKGESIHNPGIVAENVLSDVGWKQIHIEHSPLISSEEVKNVKVEARIYPDFSSQVVDPKLFYSIDSASYIEVPLIKNSSDTSKYSANIPVAKSGYISYYIKANDKYARDFIIPVNAPEESYSFFIGDDTIAPLIKHFPNTFLLPGQDSILINAFVTDGFGIDSVWIEYSYNDQPQNSVGMEILKETQYQTSLDISSLNIVDGDSIFYRVVAKDKSKVGNIAYSPDSGWTKVNVEAIPEYVESFETNFETTNSQFILQGFSFDTPDGFKNGALHSVHPYEFAGENNHLEYIAQLRYPVKVSETNPFISFDEIVLVEPGEEGTSYGDDEFWDYVIVEASKDEGKTWTYLEKAWDSGYNKDWFNAYNTSINVQFSQALGTPDMFKNHLIDITSNGRIKIGDEIIIRFRLYSDPFASGWGWAIDNLKIQTKGLSSNQLAKASNIVIYPNPVVGNQMFIKSPDERINEVSLYNFQGSLVFSTKSIINGHIFLPETIKGGYIVVVKTENKISHSKILVK